MEYIPCYQSILTSNLVAYLAYDNDFCLIYS
jgi:hypothetical protein